MSAGQVEIKFPKNCGKRQKMSTFVSTKKWFKEGKNINPKPVWDFRNVKKQTLSLQLPSLIYTFSETPSFIDFGHQAADLAAEAFLTAFQAAGMALNPTLLN